MMEVILTSDSFSMVQAAKSVLAKDGYHVILAENDDDSQAAGSQTMDTLEIIRYVRETCNLDTPVMILTAPVRA